MKIHRPPLLVSLRGMTLPEILIAVMILVPLLTIVLQNFVKCIELNSLAQQTSLAIWGERTKLAEMENTSFYNIVNSYDQRTYTVNGLAGMGVTYVDDTDPELLSASITYSWRDRAGRIIGEDRNLNGNIDAGEDVNNNGRLDSPVGMSTKIYNM